MLKTLRDREREREMRESSALSCGRRDKLVPANDHVERIGEEYPVL